VGRRGARTRQRIVEAALECFAEHGYRTTSIDDIASRAEVSRATLYQYFESKDALPEPMRESGCDRPVTEELGSRADRRRVRPPTAGSPSSPASCASMFIEWAHVNKPSAPVREAARSTTPPQRFAPRRSAGYTEEDAIAHVVLALVVGTYPPRLRRRRH
jgi:AcrR family transcriptional regulator